MKIKKELIQEKVWCIIIFIIIMIIHHHYHLSLTMPNPNVKILSPFCTFSQKWYFVIRPFTTCLHMVFDLIWCPTCILFANNWPHLRFRLSYCWTSQTPTNISIGLLLAMHENTQVLLFLGKCCSLLVGRKRRGKRRRGSEKWEVIVKKCEDSSTISPS